MSHRAIPALGTRLLLAVGLALAGLVASAASASASVSASAASAASRLADAVPSGGVMDSFNERGASGISVSQYALDLDRGGITDPTKAVVSLLVSTIWDTYRLLVGVAVWLYTQASGLGWLDYLRGPAEAVSSAVQTVVTQLGVIPLFLTLAAFICGYWMIRGRWAGGFAELIVSCVLAVAATGFLAHPVAMIAGDDGLLGRAQQFGNEFSAVIATAGRTGDVQNEQQLQDATSGALVDAFLRGPHQLINYGASVDANPACAKVYDQVLKAGPYTDDTARNRIGDCDAAFGEYADNPSTGQLAGMLVLMPAGILLLVLVLVLVLVVLIASAVVVWEAAKLSISLIKGIVPGAGRDSLYQSMASTAVSLAVVVGALAFLSAYVLAIRSALRPENAVPDSPATTFLVIDLLLVVGIIVLLRWRKQAREGARKLADRISRARPPEPTRLPSGLSGARGADGFDGSPGADGRGSVSAGQLDPLRARRMAALASGSASGSRLAGARMAQALLNGASGLSAAVAVGAAGVSVGTRGGAGGARSAGSAGSAGSASSARSARSAGSAGGAEGTGSVGGAGAQRALPGNLRSRREELLATLRGARSDSDQRVGAGVAPASRAGAGGPRGGTAVPGGGTAASGGGTATSRAGVGGGAGTSRGAAAAVGAGVAAYGGRVAADGTGRRAGADLRDGTAARRAGADGRPISADVRGTGAGGAATGTGPRSAAVMEAGTRAAGGPDFTGAEDRSTEDPGGTELEAGGAPAQGPPQREPRKDSLGRPARSEDERDPWPNPPFAGVPVASSEDQEGRRREAQLRELQLRELQRREAERREAKRRQAWGGTSPNTGIRYDDTTAADGWGRRQSGSDAVGAPGGPVPAAVGNDPAAVGDGAWGAGNPAPTRSDEVPWGQGAGGGRRQDSRSRADQFREAQFRDAQRRDAQRRDAQRVETQRVETQRVETQRAEAQRRDAQRRDVTRGGTQQRRNQVRAWNAERVQVRRAEAERLRNQRGGGVLGPGGGAE